jgi:hypothetical protein
MKFEIVILCVSLSGDESTRNASFMAPWLGELEANEKSQVEQQCADSNVDINHHVLKPRALDVTVKRFQLPQRFIHFCFALILIKYVFINN